MGKSKGKSLVTESADELFYMAELDIMGVDSFVTNPKYPVGRMYTLICFHVTMAVEKFLKGFIIYNGKPVEKIHSLDVLQEAAMNIEHSFSEIKNDCILLHTFIPNIKYNSENLISKQDMDKILESLKAICNFPPIRSMRESFSKIHNYEIVTEIIAQTLSEDDGRVEKNKAP